MTSKLKRSFVTVTMLSAALVLVILMGIVNLVNTIKRTGSDTEILQYLAENGGTFPEEHRDPSDLSASDEPEQFGFSEETGEFFMLDGKDRPGDRKGDMLSGRITAETPYETRYFSVFMSSSGELQSVNTVQIAAVSPEEAAATAQELFADGKTSGRFGNYRYLAVEQDGGILYVFLDCNKTILANRSFLIDSVFVTIGGLIVLFGLSWLLSDKAIRPMAESYEKQKSFITNAGHELKTPLAVIESSTEVLELEGGENQWTRSIHGQVKRLSTLTQDLIALARMDEAGNKPELTEQDISPVVSNALVPYAMLAEQKELSFAADIQPGLHMRSNQAALEKLCVILADNAIKYTSDGGDIRFTLKKDGNHVILRSENPADSLTPGKQEKLFDRFYRGDTSRSSETPGYGLGLPMARQLVESMGGKISAESPDGKRLIITAQL